MKRAFVIPKKFEPLLFSLILSGLMSFLVSGISTWRAAGLVPGFMAMWTSAWLMAWLFAFPAVLVVAPPPLCETANPEFAAMFAGGVEESRMVAGFYSDLADVEGCGFFDAGSVAVTTPIDGVHLDADNTRAIGRGLEPIVRMMLGL